MSKKSILGLILFGSLIIAGLFAGVNFMIGQGTKIGTEQNQSNITQQELNNDGSKEPIDITEEESWLSANPSDTGNKGQNEDDIDGVSFDHGDTNEGENNADNPNNAIEIIDASDNIDETEEIDGSNNVQDKDTTENIEDIETEDTVSLANSNDVNESEDALGDTVNASSGLQLIYDSKKVDYMAYIPEMIYSSKIETALDIQNPDIEIVAEAAILIDVETKEVLYYKNAIEPVFPASTAKILTSLVALEWCGEEEEVTLRDEIKMITEDSSRAYLKVGQVLTIRNLLEGMLVPSGNDAAYATAVYVGRKSLQNQVAPKEEAVLEFTRLMNRKAKELGAINSCFKTPDGYDAIGQYTTAYDMGVIGLAAVTNDTILEISKKSRARNVFVSGDDVTWENTNSLIDKNSGRYYSCAIGLKTGTSTMAGGCLLAAGRKDEREVVCVILNSTPSERYDDATALLKYGLN